MILLKDSRIVIILRLAQQAFGEYKLQIIILTGLGFIGGILEGIGVNALIPLFSIAMGGQGGVADDPISQFIGNAFSFLNINFSVKYLLIFISLMFIIRAVTLVIISYIKIKITAEYEEKTRNNIFHTTLQSAWPYLSKQKVGYLETILMTNIKTGSILLEQIGTVLTILASLTIYTIVAINISLYITIIVFITGGILFLVFKPLIYRSRLVSTEAEVVNKQVAHFVNENIIGMKTVKAMAIGEKVENIGKEYFNKLRKFKIKIFLLANISGSMMQPISLIFICLIFAFTYKTPGFNFASLAVIIYLVQRMFIYFQQLQANLHTTNEVAPYLKSVLKYQEQALESKEAKGGSENFKFNNELEFKNVGFSYSSGRQVLSGINFKIKKGEMVGLIGSSGAGKTTMVDLFLRLLDPVIGEILLDSRNITDINMEKWRKNIGYVSQDIFLMNDTVANNIKFYDKSITNKEMEEAAKMANIYNFIQSLPDNFSSVIGERGMSLSVGQRQRIVIARVLARQPKILILDEATSALDNESEIKIQRVIENLKNKVTVLVIAHRLSTVINSDKLMILKDGKIVEEGSPDKMLKDKESYYYKMFNLRK
ncbi:MAG: ABC transporter ATP-binding protein [Patescibacteria group bacterium]